MKFKMYIKKIVMFILTARVVLGKSFHILKAVLSVLYESGRITKKFLENFPGDVIAQIFKKSGVLKPQSLAILMYNSRF